MIRLRLPLLLGIAACLAACIDDPAAVDDQFALTQEDAVLLGLNFWRQALEAQIDVDVDGQPAAASSAPARAPQVFTATDTTVVMCQLDGEVQRIVEATATVDDETGEVEIAAVGTLTHDGCRQEIDGQTFSFYGAPSILLRITISYDSEGTQTLLGGIEGSAVVITEGLPVLCTADIEAGPGVVVDGSVTYSIRGSFCGQEFDETRTEAIG